MSSDRLGTRLSAPDFKRDSLQRVEKLAVMQTFGSHLWVEAQPRRWQATGSECLVAQVVGTIGDGKEATVYQCQSAAQLDFESCVAKVYRAQQFRAFSNSTSYIDTEKIRDRRTRRALRNKTKRGRMMAHGIWIEREWETLCALHDAGADVPEPYAHSADAILMEFIGDEDGPALPLRRSRLDTEESRRAFETTIENIEIFLACDRVHGDLSAYNILWWQGRICVIDLPQAVEASTSPDAYTLLRRDVHNVCRGFARAGISSDPGAIAHSLWGRYQRGQL